MVNDKAHLNINTKMLFKNSNLSNFSKAPTMISPNTISVPEVITNNKSMIVNPKETNIF